MVCRHCAKEIRLNRALLHWFGTREYYHLEPVDGDKTANRYGLFCDSRLKERAEPREEELCVQAGEGSLRRADA